MKKNQWYYKNTRTGETTESKETKNNWVLSGADVEHIRFSEIFDDFICFMVEEGRIKN